MSVDTVVPATFSKVVLFNGSEGVDPDDFNLVSDLLALKTLDWPLVPDMASLVADADDETGFLSATRPGLTTLTTAAFAFGPGCKVHLNTGAHQSIIQGGILAIYDPGVASARVAATDPTPTLSSGVKMANIIDGDITFTHTLNVAGSDRVDAVCVKMDVVDDRAEDELTRDMKDGATGALTTGVFMKRRTTVATFSMVEGTPGSGMPDWQGTLGDNYRLLYSVVMPASSGTIGTLKDFILPLGRREAEFVMAARCRFAATWSTADTSGEINTTTNGAVALIIPSCFGDGLSRLLGVELVHALQAGGTVELVRIAGPTVTLLNALSAGTMDGTVRSVKFDFSMEAASDPFWANGLAFKRFGSSYATHLQGLGIRVTANGTSANIVYGAKFIFAR